MRLAWVVAIATPEREKAMQVYEISYDDKGGEPLSLWVGSRRHAAQARKKLRSEGADIWGTYAWSVPTNKKGLLGWLNRMGVRT